MTSRTSLRVIAAVILLAAALAYLTQSTPAQSAQQGPTAAQEAAISQVTAFQRAATAADSVPGATLLSGQVRRVGSAATARPVWASIDPTQDCVQVGQEGASACASPRRLAVEPLIVGSLREVGVRLSPDQPPPPAEEWAGLAENGVEAIEARYADGSVEIVPVVNNGFYFATGGRRLAAVSWVTGGGAVHTYQEG